MDEQAREQSAIAELNQFLELLQSRYGVVVRPCLTTNEFPGGQPERVLSINVKAIEGWKPPGPPKE